MSCAALLLCSSCSTCDWGVRNENQRGVEDSSGPAKSQSAPNGRDPRASRPLNTRTRGTSYQPLTGPAARSPRAGSTHSSQPSLADRRRCHAPPLAVPPWRFLQAGLSSWPSWDGHRADREIVWGGRVMARGEGPDQQRMRGNWRNDACTIWGRHFIRGFSQCVRSRFLRYVRLGCTYEECESPTGPISPEETVLDRKRYASHATNTMHILYNVSTYLVWGWHLPMSPLRFIASSPPPHFSLHLYPEPNPPVSPMCPSYPISLTSPAMEHRSLPWLQSREPVLAGRSAPR